MDAAEEMDALASPRVQSHKDDVGGAAQPRASIFQGFSIPGLRGKALAKVTAPAKQTRPDKNSIMVPSNSSDRVDGNLSIPGLRGRAAAKLTAPAKQTRPDKNSLFVVPSKSVTAARLPLNDGNPNPSPNPGAIPLPWP